MVGHRRQPPPLDVWLPTGHRGHRGPPPVPSSLTPRDPSPRQGYLATWVGSNVPLSAPGDARLQVRTGPGDAARPWRKPSDWRHLTSARRRPARPHTRCRCDRIPSLPIAACPSCLEVAIYNCIKDVARNDAPFTCNLIRRNRYS